MSTLAIASRNSPLRPFAIMASVAFVIGFLGYLTLAGVTLDQLQAQMSLIAAPQAPAMENAASAPVLAAPADPWDQPRKI